MYSQTFLERAWFPLVCLAAAAAGCTGPVYEHGRASPAAVISGRTRWRAFGNLRDPGNAIDGEIGTAAVADEARGDAAITIDLGKMCVLNMVVVEHGSEEMGFCRSLALETSTDGRIYVRHRTAPGTRRLTHVLLVRPVAARYVRIQSLGAGPKPWHVAEVYVQ